MPDRENDGRIRSVGECSAVEMMEMDRNPMHKKLCKYYFIRKQSHKKVMCSNGRRNVAVRPVSIRKGV